MISAGRHKSIYTISRLTSEISLLLEEHFPFVWVTGEISNYTVPASGHAYFSLKDDQAMISCVMFKNQRKSVKFDPENGLRVMGLGRVSIYAPRGTYQLIFDHLEPEGVGALSLAFEQLKKKLAEEGLFDQSHKKELPFFPDVISVITSGTGAAVRDIIKVSSRRCPCCTLQILPVKVQGQGADQEMIHALEAVNRRNDSQVIILARGGGSMEDLAIFNSEPLARAVFASRIPVVTGIGHETDFTIADFVADFRAPTPSAAALAALPDQAALAMTVQAHVTALRTALHRKVGTYREQIASLESRLKKPSRIIHDYMMRLEDLETRAGQAVSRKISHVGQNYTSLAQRLHAGRPSTVQKQKELQNMIRALHQAMERPVQKAAFRMKTLEAGLDSMNPVSVLNRGYSITRTRDTGQVITDKDQTYLDQSLEIVLAKGKIHTRVEASK